MKNDRDFVRMCKFKYGVISGSSLYTNIPLNSIIYSLSDYNNYRVLPNAVVMPNYINLTPYSLHMFGGDINKKDHNEIGKLIDVGTVKSIKLVDFHEFEKEYESKNKNVNCPHISKDVANAYKLLRQIDTSDNDSTIIDVIDEIETLLEVLKYCVVSIDTYKEYNLIKKQKLRKRLQLK